MEKQLLDTVEEVLDTHDIKELRELRTILTEVSEIDCGPEENLQVYEYLRLVKRKINLLCKG